MVDDIWVGWWKLGSTCLLLGGVSRVNTHIHMCTIEKGEIEQAEENTKKEDQNLRGQGDMIQNVSTCVGFYSQALAQLWSITF